MRSTYTLDLLIAANQTAQNRIQEQRRESTDEDEKHRLNGGLMALRADMEALIIELHAVRANPALVDEEPSAAEAVAAAEVPKPKRTKKAAPVVEAAPEPEPEAENTAGEAEQAEGDAGETEQAGEQGA